MSVMDFSTVGLGATRSTGMSSQVSFVSGPLEGPRDLDTYPVWTERRQEKITKTLKFVISKSTGLLKSQRFSVLIFSSH